MRRKHSPGGQPWPLKVKVKGRDKGRRSLAKGASRNRRAHRGGRGGGTTPPNMVEG